MSAVAKYNEALSQLIDAVNALDQAHAMLKDIDLHTYIQTRACGRLTSLKEAVDIADGLLRDLQNVTCPDCGKPMAESEECLSGVCPEIAGHVHG